MKEADLIALEQRLGARMESVVVKTVNGKIDGLRKEVGDHIVKHEADMLEIKPFIQGAAGVRILGDGFKWVAGLAVAWVAVKTFLQGHPF